MPEYKTTIAILNYNGRQHLEKYLPSVVEYSPNTQITVIDNASTDDSILYIKSEYPDIHLIELSKNHGFAGGYNEGLRFIDSEYTLLLNSDVRVSPNWVEPLEQILENNKDVVSVQPKILSDQLPDTFEYAGACGGYIDYLGYPFCRGRIFDNTEKDTNQYDSPKEVSWTSGAAMLIRTKAFKDLGGFDTDYFAHMEEIDLCIRVQRAGFKLQIEPKAIVYHLGGGTIDYQSSRKTYLNFRNNLITLLKNEKTTKLLWLIPLRLSLDGIAGIKYVIDGKFKHCLAIIQAHFAFYGHMPKAIKKRKDFHNNHPHSQGRWKKHNKSIVRQYFLNGINHYSEL